MSRLSTKHEVHETDPVKLTEMGRCGNCAEPRNGQEERCPCDQPDCLLSDPVRICSRCRKAIVRNLIDRATP